jgi:hypothetical protein
MKKTIKRILVLCLTAVILLMSVSSVVAATIYYYFGYYYTNISNDKVSLYGIDDEEYDFVFVPDTLNNKKLVDIRNNAFNNNTDIRYIEFAGATNLERIGSFAFNGCTNVTGEIKIPSNVVDIDVAAFQNCTSLDSVVYNSECGYVPKQCFKGCTSLSSVTLNNSVEEICGYAFAGCTSLSEITIPRSVTAIDSTAFDNDDDIVIQCYRDSYAQQYARDNSIKYIVLDPAKGDANCDGNFNISDATAVQKYKAGLINLPEPGLGSGDVNGDGQVTVRDATLIQMRIANIINEF